MLWRTAAICSAWALFSQGEIPLWAGNAPSVARKAPGKELAEKVIRSAIVSRRFQGGKIQELMLSEPEQHNGAYRYQGEFRVNHQGRTIHCEDWHFLLREFATGWINDETTPGRCND